MAIEKVDRLPPHVAIRQEIEKQRRSVMVTASGLGPVMSMLDAYVAATEARLVALEDGYNHLAKDTDNET